MYVIRLHEVEVIPRYAPQQVIGRVKGQTPNLVD
jgi:hypothetical protein